LIENFKNQELIETDQVIVLTCNELVFVMIFVDGKKFNGAHYLQQV